MCVIVLVITVVVLVCSQYADRRAAAVTPTPRRQLRDPNARKEGFLLTSQNAYIDPVTGAIKGPGIMTDGMVRKPMKEILKSVRDTGFGSDDTPSLGVSAGNGFDKAYKAQQEIDAIDQRAVDGYQQQSALDAISKRIGSYTNNANNNVYTRAGSRPTKMIIAPNEIRGVIDAKYLPDRDKNYQIASVQAAVPVQGYDVTVERLGEYLTDTHFSKISKHGGRRHRIPTAAGATGGGSKMNNSLDLGDSANAKAISQSIGVDNGNVVVENNGELVDIPLEGDAPESFRTRYVRGNHL